MDEDEQLWEQLESGDVTVWPRIVQRHWKPIRRFFVNRVGDDADDLTQITFLRLQQRRGSFAKRGSFRAFLFGIANNVLLEHVRRKQRDERIELGDISAAALDPSPSSVLCHRREQRLILQGLRNLTLDHQIVLELHYWEAMTDREIAEVLKINVNTVRSRITRARNALQKIIEHLEHGRPPSTSADLETWMQDMRQVWADDAKPPIGAVALDGPEGPEEPSPAQ